MIFGIYWQFDVTCHISRRQSICIYPCKHDSSIYPIYYGCLSILLPILLDDYSLWLLIINPSREAEYNGWFLTDVLLFTHLVHLLAAYASKIVQWSYALRSFKEISHRLGLFETVRRALKTVRRAFENYLVCNSCQKQIWYRQR